jgi:molybdopterin-binding protein
MQLSARNQLRGKVKEITLGNIMAEVIIELADGQEVVALITYTSSERLNLRIGDDVTAIFKSTDVMLGKGDEA